MSQNDRILKMAKKVSLDLEDDFPLIETFKDLFASGKLNDMRISKLVQKARTPEIRQAVLDAIDEAALNRDVFYTTEDGTEWIGGTTFWAIPIYGMLKDIDSWLNDPSTPDLLTRLFRDAEAFTEESSLIAFSGAYSPYLVGEISHSELYNLTGLLSECFTNMSKNENPIQNIKEAISSLRMEASDENSLGVRIALVGVLELVSTSSLEDDLSYFNDKWEIAIDSMNALHTNFSIDIPVPLSDVHRSAFKISVEQWETLCGSETIIIDFTKDSFTMSLTAADGDLAGRSFEIDMAILRQHFEELLMELVEENPTKYLTTLSSKQDIDESQFPYIN